MTKPNPYFKYAWKLANRLDQLTRRVYIPKRRCTWCVIGVALAMLAATLASLFLLHHSRPAGTRCYASGTFDGLNIYLASNKTTMQSCGSAAKGSGLTNLSSLPPGVQQVCANATVTVYMTPVQVRTVRGLGLNPASICG